MNYSVGVDDVVLDLTQASEDGKELVFKAPISYLIGLCNQLSQNEIDGAYVIGLEFDDVHPVAARVDNYLGGTDYDSIGVGIIGPDNSRYKNDEVVGLHIRCNRSQLRRFALLNRRHLESPIIFTAEVPLENGEAFVDAVKEIEKKIGDTSE